MQKYLSCLTPQGFNTGEDGNARLAARQCTDVCCADVCCSPLTPSVHEHLHQHLVPEVLAPHVMQLMRQAGPQGMWFGSH